MPDIELFLEAQEDMPVFSQDILDGLAVKGLLWAKEEVDTLIECAEKAYPEGFEFARSRICSPKEAIIAMSSLLSKSSDRDPSIDLAPTDVYLVEYQFTFNGQDLIKRYLFLPYARTAGLMMIAAKFFSISPVASDPGLSIGPDYVFVRFSRAPVTFRQTLATLNVNGEEVSEYLAYSWLHNRGGANNKTNQSDTLVIGGALATLPHYLFAKYGLEESFRKFAGTEFELTKIDIPYGGEEKDRWELTRECLMAQGYDLSSWTVYSSAHYKPTALKMKTPYKAIATNVVMLVPTRNVSKLTSAFVRAFFYMLDHFPEPTSGISFEEYLVELRGEERWKIWMGYIQFGDQYGVGKLTENINHHLASLDQYVDIEARRMFMEEERLDIDDIYQLFCYILNNIEELINNKEEDIGTMYGKRLQTSQYVLRDITASIFRCLFEITNNKKRKFEKEDYNKTLGKYFMPTIIFNLRKTSQKPFMSSVSTPGDNMYPKITSRLVMQAQTSSGRKPSNLNVNDPTSWLHASIAELGNHLVLPKNTPLGRMTLNPTARLDDKGTTQRKESMAPTVEYIGDAISRN
jgi:hypothetical protein